MRWRRIIAVLLSVAFLLSNNQAQTGDWQAVEAIPSGSAISIKNEAGRIKCTLERVTDDELLCVERRQLLGAPVLRFYRDGIREVSLDHPGRSAFFGAIIGTGAGAAIGYAGSRNSNDAETRVYTPIGMAILFGTALGFIMGRLAIPHGKVVYRR
jgi:hypothetical protein